MISVDSVRVPPLSPPAAVGSPFVPAVEDSAAPHAAEVGPMVGVTPPGLLPPFRVANDYMGALRVSDYSPVGGRVSLFIQKWQVITSDSFILSVVKDGFKISVQSNFPGVIRKITVTPKDPKVILLIQEEIRDLISKNAIVQINDFPSLCLSPIFVIPKKSGDLSVILNLKAFNLFILTQHFRMETLERYSSTAFSKRLGCVDRFERCLPPHSSSSAIQEVLGFPIHEHDLPVQGSAFRPQRLAMGLYKGSSYSCGPSPPSRTSSLLLSGRLAPSGGVQGALAASSSDDPAMDPGSGFPCELEEVFPGTAETSCLSRGSAGHPKFVGSCLAPALLWQKFLGHLTSFVDLVPNCRMLMRPLQLHFLRYFTPLIDPQDKLVPWSPEIKVLCRAWASPSRLLEGIPFAPPPHFLVISTDTSLQGWGRFFILSEYQGCGRRLRLWTTYIL